MANYYEMLKVQPTATDKEIETAIDARYNQWRALVTHHDPNVVNQANQAIQLLEQIRATLTDPAKRAVYDEAIGVKGATTDLVDPTAVMNKSRVTMPPPSPSRLPVPNPTVGATGAAGTVNAWVCPKCSVANGIGTRFCKDCGTALGRECPNCGKTIEAIAKFCPDCGVDVAKATFEKQIAEEKRRQWEESEGYWQQRIRQLELDKPATYVAAFRFSVRGSFGDCIGAIAPCLTSKPGGYALKMQTQDSENGTFVAAEGGMDDLYVQVLVETAKSVDRRIFVRFARNRYPVDNKPVRLILPVVEKFLRQTTQVVDVTAV